MIPQKKNRFKTIVLLTFVLFSLFFSGAIYFVFKSSMDMDLQHVQVVSLSADIDNKILRTRVLIDDFILKNDSVNLRKLSLNLDEIKAGFEKLNSIFINEFKKIDNNDLKDLTEEYQIISGKFSSLKDYITNIELKNEFSGSSVLNIYTGFSLSYRYFGQYLQRYLYDNTILYKRKIFGLFAIIFLFMILSGYLIIRLINQLIIIDRTLLQNTIEVENRERKRIAADLHDELGAFLSSIIMYIQVLEKDYEKDTVLIKKIENLNQLSKQALISVEEVINNLNPSMLSKYGFIKALEKAITRVNSLNKTQFSLDSSNLKTKLLAGTEIVLFRICSELINNALKHSEAKNANFTIFSSRKKIYLTYEDNGIGFSNDKLPYEDNKTGLYNLAKRVDSVGGIYKISSEPGDGVTIKIALNHD